MLLFYLISFIVLFSLFPFIFSLFVKRPQEAALPHCIKHTMIIKETSPIALLHAAASECHLQYVSLITEIASDQTVLCGVELELPQRELIGPRREFFFWEPVFSEPSLAYAKACLKAVSFLQIFFNLKITNYYCAGMLIYRELNIEHQSEFMAYNFPLKVNHFPRISTEPHYRDNHS